MSIENQKPTQLTMTPKINKTKPLAKAKRLTRSLQTSISGLHLHRSNPYPKKKTMKPTDDP